MARATKDTEKTFEKNLEYIGLKLNRLPNFIKDYESLNFRPSKSYDDTVYKVYRYVNIKDIQILITPADRLMDIKERYKLASPLIAYLDSKKEENIEKFAPFIKMVTTMNKDRIEEIAKEQEILNDKIPYEVKYPNNFIWQIYYSDYAKKYFMLVPTNEQDNNAFFYLLKEQIANSKAKKGRFIFVPISHLEYSGQWLTQTEISDIENYLWYFTKEWPNVYEIFDKKGNMFIKIVGIANVYDKMKSTYSIRFDTKEEAMEFYKLLKAMFILATGAKEEFSFETRIGRNGELEFWNKDTKLQYDELSEFIKLQYLDKIDRLKAEEKERKELKRKLEKFKNIIEDLTQEYLLRQKQIATFLECKKTFFGKVRYFFRKKKEVKQEQKPVIQKEERKIEKDESLEELYALKQMYTIEDLINICTKLEEVVKENTNYNLDIKEIEAKKDILTKKIDNADLYIKEIDKHKKSIFEFWKFTSKDEVQTLAEGEEEEENEKAKMHKYFDYESDLEDLGKMVDELQRRKLSKNETDAIFAIKQVPDSFAEINKEGENDVEIFVEKKVEEEESEEAEEKAQESEKGEEIDEISGKKTKGRGKSKKPNTKATALEKDLAKLKKEYEDDIEIINAKDFDIFGGLIEDHTKVKAINNEKHREIEKDKYKVLNINLDTDIKAYTQNLESYLNLIKEALNKIQSPYDMSVYALTSKKSLGGMQLFSMNPKDAIENELKSKKAKLMLYKLNIKEGTPAVFYTNIMFYDNNNKTLPVGMHLSSDVLIDTDKLNIEFVKENNFYINYKIDEFDFGTKQIQVFEYEVRA